MSYQTCGCQGLDIFLGGDDIERKKPDPSIYITAAERLGVQPSECVVIEDSIVGLKARAEPALPRSALGSASGLLWSASTFRPEMETMKQ